MSSTDDSVLTDVLRRAGEFQAVAHGILARHEAAQSRVVILEDTYAELGALTLKQDDLFRQGLRCAESGLFRAAHVMAWAAFMDFLEDKLASDGLVKVRTQRPAWKSHDMHELREYVPERQLVEVAQAIGLCSKNETQSLVGLLQRRNECAHPSEYLPGLNETLGYLSELIQRIRLLQPRVL